MTDERGGALRADLALVGAGLFESRAKAREAIEAGLVRADGRLLSRPAATVHAGARLEAAAPHLWVSRGGVKLAAALDQFDIDPAGRHCLDAGASTGGFCDVLLQRGAASVLAVDVGHGQLHPRLRDEPRLRLLEHRDARTLTAADLPVSPNLITVDVSFISLRLVLPALLPLAGAGALAVLLVKPQFEAGPARVTKGIVRDPAVRAEVGEAVSAAVTALGWTVLGLMPSPIEGGDGNRESLLAARR